MEKPQLTAEYPYAHSIPLAYLNTITAEKYAWYGILVLLEAMRTLVNVSFTKYTFLMKKTRADIFANSEIMAVKDIILNTVDCEKIYLFGSYACNTQQCASDYDLYIVLKNNDENSVFAEQNIYRNLSKREGRNTPVDILAENINTFNNLCTLPSLERKIVREGVLLYDNTGLV